MSTFEVTVHYAEILPHENADSLELCKIGEYLSVVRKGQIKTGDLVAYIPEASIVPDNILQELGLEGKLAGSKKNRVKAMKLRGILSQGIVYHPSKDHWNIGDNVAEELGIAKYEPIVPAHLSGQVFNAENSFRFHYDIENIKKYNKIIEKGTEVVFTEKCHGTFCRFTVIPENQQYDFVNEQGRLLIASKGLGSQGLYYKNNEENDNNLYVKMARSLNIVDRVSKLGLDNEVVSVIGEIFGSGVQDLSYGCQQPVFRVFDIFIGKYENGRYLNDRELDEVCTKLELSRVPVLYRGPFSWTVLDEFTNGKETVSGKGVHVREGVVVRPTTEMYSPSLPGHRVQLKSVSEGYLLRKNGTEYT